MKSQDKTRSTTECITMMNLKTVITLCKRSLFMTSQFIEVNKEVFKNLMLQV